MFLVRYAVACGALFAAILSAPLQAQQPMFTTTRVEGTDNVYIFRYQNHQSMFIVTPAGVIATDPIGLTRPQAVTTYIAEIRKITPAPIRYVIYSHQHFDHIAGGKPFKDLGATFVALRRTKERLEATKYEDVVIPDEVFDERRTLSLGGTVLELTYVGRNHSDKQHRHAAGEGEADLRRRLHSHPVGLGAAFNDAYPIEWEDSLQRVLAMDWERMIPGHPYIGRLGTKKDVEDLLAYMNDLSGEVKKAAHAGKCWDAAEKEVRLPKYASWPGYEQGIASNIRRYCGYWGRGF